MRKGTREVTGILTKGKAGSTQPGMVVPSKLPFGGRKKVEKKTRGPKYGGQNLKKKKGEDSI